MTEKIEECTQKSLGRPVEMKRWSKTSAISCAWNFSSPIGSFGPNELGGFNIDVKLSWTRQGQNIGLGSSELKEILKPFDHAVLNQVFTDQLPNNEVLTHFRLLREMWNSISKDVRSKGLEPVRLALVFDDQTAVAISPPKGASARFSFPLRSMASMEGSRTGIDKEVFCIFRLSEEQTFLASQERFQKQVKSLQDRLLHQTLDEALALPCIQDLSEALFKWFSSQNRPLQMVTCRDTFSDRSSSYLIDREVLPTF